MPDVLAYEVAAYWNLARGRRNRGEIRVRIVAKITDKPTPRMPIADEYRIGQNRPIANPHLFLRGERGTHSGIRGETRWAATASTIATMPGHVLLLMFSRRPIPLLLLRPLAVLLAAILVAAVLPRRHYAQDKPDNWLTRLFQPPPASPVPDLRSWLRRRDAVERPVRRVGQSADDGGCDPRGGGRFQQLHRRSVARCARGAASRAKITIASPRA